MAARHDSARLGLPRPEPPERTCGEQPIDQPVENVLKIDRAFIARIDTDADNRAIVRCDAQKLIGSLYNIEKVHGLCKFHVSPEP